MNAEQIASETKQWFQSAVGDIAYDNVDYDGNPKEWATDELREKVKKAKKDGVRDIGGWLGDEMYNDPDYLDMVADHIGDMSCTHKASKHEIWVEFKKIIHSTLHARCDEYIERYKKEWELELEQANLDFENARNDFD